MSVQFETPRLQIVSFKMSDAEELFTCITSTVTRFMPWEVPQSLQAYKARRLHEVQTADPSNFSFVVRRKDTKECLGAASLENIAASQPEIGIWLKMSAHGHGYATEVIRALVEWAFKTLKKKDFIYPVAIENVASRRVAEKLDGKIIGHRASTKYDSVIYLISCSADSAVAADCNALKSQ